jgi:hypothetical protein
MTGRRGEAGPGGRPRLQIVPDLDRGPDSGPGTRPEPDDDDLIEVVFADGPDGADVEDGADVDLEFLLVPLLIEAERQMRSIRRPLDAELWASELLGMLELGAPDDSTPEERDAVRLNLATRLAEYAMDQDSLSGLAMLRTLSVIGPGPSRELAAGAAARLAAGGLRDRAWVPSLGRPDVGRCWRFADPDGHQESVTVVFRYGKREHALTVLIDHDLGGGVKDCWIGENPAGMLAETRAALAADGIEVEVIAVEEATDALRTALTRPECPETPDEIEDVAMCRALLRSRVNLLVTGPNTGPNTGPTGSPGTPPGTLVG